MLVFMVLLFGLVGLGCSQASTGSDSEKDESTGTTETQEVASADYPSKPIEILVPFAAGGSTDTTARVLSKYLPKYLPNEVNIVIVNKPGAGGTIAATDLFKAEPDGYTLELATHRSIAMQPVYGQTEYSYDSFQPIAKVTTEQQVMAVRADAPWDTFEDWLDYVNENPGQFTYAVSGGIGSGSHLPMAELEMEAEFEATAVAYDGTAPAMTAVLGGQVDGAIGQPSSVKGFVESGEMKMLFNAGATPVPYAPEVPLLIDKGYDIAYDSNASLLAPNGIPEEVLTILEAALEEALADPDLLAELENVDIQVDYKPAEGVQEELTEEYNKSKDVLTKLGLI